MSGLRDGRADKPVGSSHVMRGHERAGRDLCRAPPALNGVPKGKQAVFMVEFSGHATLLSPMSRWYGAGDRCTYRQATRRKRQRTLLSEFRANSAHRPEICRRAYTTRREEGVPFTTLTQRFFRSPRDGEIDGE